MSDTREGAANHGYREARGLDGRLAQYRVIIFESPGLSSSNPDEQPAIVARNSSGGKRCVGNGVVMSGAKGLNCRAQKFTVQPSH